MSIASSRLSVFFMIDSSPFIHSFMFVEFDKMDYIVNMIICKIHKND